jgi:UDP-N-acetylmuramyl tripeptide synthase
MERRALSGARSGRPTAAPRGLCLYRTRLAALSAARRLPELQEVCGGARPSAVAAAAAAAPSPTPLRRPRRRVLVTRASKASSSSAPADDYDEDEEALEDDDYDEEDGVIDAEAQDVDDDGDAPLDDEDADDDLPDPPQRALPVWELLSRAGHSQASRRLRERYPDLLAFDVADDPARVVPGDVFVCRQTLRDGALWDGHAHAAAAARAGAALIVAERALDTTGEPVEVLGCPQGDDTAAAARATAASSYARPTATTPPPLPNSPIPSNVPVVVVPDADDAAGALASAFYDWPSLRMRVVAVAGSSGKTTAGWLVRAVLEEAGQLTGMIGSVEHAVGDVRLDPRTGHKWEPTEDDPTAGRESSAPFMLPPHRGKYPCPADVSAPGAPGGAVPTTPDPILLQKLLGGMADRGATAAVVETTAEALALGYCDWLQPDVALVTRVDPQEAPEQAEALGGADAYVSLHAEGWLGRVLTDAQAQRAVVNLDDPAAKRLLAAVAATGGGGGGGSGGGSGGSSTTAPTTPVPVITYALDDPSADVWAERVELSLWETRLVVRTPQGRLELIADVVGRGNARHALAAVAVGVALGVPLERIGAGIEAAGPVPGRGEVVDRPERDAPFAIVVDAADTPKRIEAVLKDVREAGARRVFAVFGADGERARRDLRAACGAALHAHADFVVFTNASPKREDPAAVVADLVSGLPEEVTAPYAGWVYPPFQDQGRVPLWFEPFVHAAQRKARRYVMEDRFSAIRAAVGTARAEDAVVILGRGDRDWVEHWGGYGDEGGVGGEDGAVVVGAAAAEQDARRAAAESGDGSATAAALAPGGGRQRGGLVVRGWLDDRAEARSALSRLHYLASVKGLDRSELPWRGEKEASTSAASATGGGVARVVELLK